MKTERAFIALAIVIAVISLGIAYASITLQTLKVEGSVTATADATNFDVKFSGAGSVTGDNPNSSTAGIKASDTTGRTAEFNFVGLTQAGQSQSVTFTISNENDANISANIEVSEPEWTNKEHFTVTKELSSETIAANKTATLTVTVTCIKTPLEDVTDDSIEIGLTATPVSQSTTQSGT